MYEGQAHVQLEASEVITVDGCTCVHESCPQAKHPGEAVPQLGRFLATG
ncbi:hypothetical protein [Nocardia cyriacigeorgica]|nr:hypothetical protein [Nocardia cyriacigeorgica]